MVHDQQVEVVGQGAQRPGLEPFQRLPLPADRHVRLQLPGQRVQHQVTARMIPGQPGQPDRHERSTGGLATWGSLTPAGALSTGASLGGGVPGPLAAPGAVTTPPAARRSADPPS